MSDRALCVARQELAMREVRLYWRTGRVPLTLEDKQWLTAGIIDGPGARALC